MSAPMTPEQLAEILARAAVATAGPWCTDSWEIYQGAEYVPGMSFWIGETCRGVSGAPELEQDRADAAFVAAARTDVPDLVAEVQRLRDELVPYRALELGTPEGRVSAKCDKVAHPVWLRDLDDVRGCPWCRVTELEAQVRTLAVQARGALPMPAGGASRDLRPGADAARRMIERSPEDPHDGPLHQSYALPHDLPELPAQSDQWGQA